MCRTVCRTERPGEHFGVGQREDHALPMNQELKEPSPPSTAGGRVRTSRLQSGHSKNRGAQGETVFSICFTHMASPQSCSLISMTPVQGLWDGKGCLMAQWGKDVPSFESWEVIHQYSPTEYPIALKLFYSYEYVPKKSINNKFSTVE